jgi:hypothetical protein
MDNNAGLAVASPATAAAEPPEEELLRSHHNPNMQAAAAPHNERLRASIPLQLS